MSENQDPNSQKNNQKIPRYSKKASSRGGFRKGSGRKPGSTDKLRASQLLHAIQKTTGKSLPFLIAEHYQASVDRGDWQSVKDYEKAFLAKVISDKVDVDHTTQGQALNAVFHFPAKELPDWTNVSKTITVEAEDVTPKEQINNSTMEDFDKLLEEFNQELEQENNDEN